MAIKQAHAASCARRPPGSVVVAFLQIEMGSQFATQKVSFGCQPKIGSHVRLPPGSCGGAGAPTAVPPCPATPQGTRESRKAAHSTERACWRRMASIAAASCTHVAVLTELSGSSSSVGKGRIGRQRFLGAQTLRFASLWRCLKMSSVHLVSMAYRHVVSKPPLVTHAYFLFERVK